MKRRMIAVLMFVAISMVANAQLGPISQPAITTSPQSYLGSLTK